VAGAAVLIAVAALAFRLGGGRTATPVMANAGNAGATSPLSTRAPDISQMTPRERFDRLFDRVMGAAERGDSTTVTQFSPMALGAYDMLDQVDADARYHAAMIHLVNGGVDAALALADTIQRAAPNHLFGYLIRVEGPHAERFAGRPVPVTRRDRSETEEKLDALLWSGVDEESGKPVALYTFEARPRDEKIDETPF
jgi:hypothetical protein